MSLFIVFLMLLALSVLVVIHELGHFWAARMVGVEVEAFAIGWGPTIFKWKGKSTEYRIALLPLGGYCKMKGESYLTSAYENPKDSVIAEKNSFYGISSWKRIIIAIAGPVFNLMFAFLGFILLTNIEPSPPNYSNKIILSSDFTQPTMSNPALISGLKSGDKILKWNDRPLNNYFDLNQAIEKNELKEATLTIERNGQFLTLKITPSLDKSYSPRIGVYDWKEPIIKNLRSDTTIFRVNDQIQSIDNIKISNHMEIYKALVPTLNAEILLQFKKTLKGLSLEGKKSEITFSRDGLIKKEFISKTDELFPGNVEWVETGKPSEPRFIFYSIQEGFWRTFSTLNKMFISVGDLILGKVSIGDALSGPIRIVATGEKIAVQGFQNSFTTGITSVLNFMVILSLALFFMNMLPIPALDGGLIVLNIVETIRRKSFRPITIIRFQQIGVVIILTLLVFSTFNDIKSLISNI